MNFFAKILTIFSLIFISGESFAKNKKHAIKSEKKSTKSEKIFQPINIFKEYFFQINLTQKECEKITGGECFRRDQMRDEPYFHATRITIFNDKVFAEQFFKDEAEPDNRLFLKIKDGSYQLETAQKNLITFSLKNGIISELKLLKGDLNKENNEPTNCEIASAILGFARAYDPLLIVAKSRFFKDDLEFEGLKEVLVFAEKNLENAPLMAVIKNSKKDFPTIDSLNLCKDPDYDFLLRRTISRDQCLLGFEEDAARCAKQQYCQNYLTVKNCRITFLAEPLF